jgi:hypothetical protein
MFEARKLRKELNETWFSDDQANKTIQTAKDTLTSIACTTGLVDACELGMTSLSDVHDTIALPSGQFSDLFIYQRTRKQDHGKSLADLFDKQRQLTEASAKQHRRASSRRKFDATILAENARIVDRTYANPHDRQYGYDREAKRYENRSSTQNGIMDALYLFKGADAWAFVASLRARGSLIGEIAKIHKDRLKSFMDATVKRLRKCEFEKLPDDTPIFHFLAWLAWLLRKT